MIAALFVDENGPYSDIEGVDAWGESRDARKYNGPYPVVAHPPCARWSIMANLVYSLNPIEEKLPGNDGGCFESALDSVNKYGGVLEHPAKSSAFQHFGLAIPRSNGWQQNIDGSWICQVYQSAYGHLAPKCSWLYYCGENPPILAILGNPNTNYVVGKARTRLESVEIPKSQRHITPIKFRDYLIDLAINSAQKRGNP